MFLTGYRILVIWISPDRTSSKAQSTARTLSKRPTNQRPMITLTQLVYINPGEEATFEEFERKVLPLIDEHNGRLLLRIRTDAGSLVAGTWEKPDEIHLVEIDAESDFHAYMVDEERRRYLHLREQSIRTTIIIQGTMK